MAERRRAVFLFSDTGGGHRSAAEAVAEAVARHAADDVEVLLVDALHNYAPTPFNRLPRPYPPRLTPPPLRRPGSAPPPFFAVVTDLVTGHSLWYHHRLELCFLPTAEAEHRALVNGMKPERLRVVGLPVAERFCAPPGDRAQLRAEPGPPPG